MDTKLYFFAKNNTHVHPFLRNKLKTVTLEVTSVSLLSAVWFAILNAEKKVDACERSVPHDEQKN